MKVSAKGFVGFLNASGRSRVGAVANCQEPYRPERDFYKRLREALERQAEVGDISELPIATDLTGNPSKQTHFSLFLRALQDFYEVHEVEFLPVRKCSWVVGELEVSLPSTFRLRVNGQPHIVMFWYKASEPTRNEVEYFSSLLQLAYGPSYPQDRFGVLDARGSGLRVAASDQWMENFLAAETLAFTAIWDTLELAA